MLIKNVVLVPEHLLPKGAANFLRQQGILAGWGAVARKSNTSFFLQEEAYQNTWLLNGFFWILSGVEMLFLFSVTDC